MSIRVELARLPAVVSPLIARITLSPGAMRVVVPSLLAADQREGLFDSRLVELERSRDALRSALMPGVAARLTLELDRTHGP